MDSHPRVTSPLYLTCLPSWQVVLIPVSCCSLSFLRLVSPSCSQSLMKYCLNYDYENGTGSRLSFTCSPCISKIISGAWRRIMEQCPATYWGAQ